MKYFRFCGLRIFRRCYQLLFQSENHLHLL
nr:MAG TPA: hypothetical protein [Caudoviricetes sp.]